MLFFEGVFKKFFYIIGGSEIEGFSLLQILLTLLSLIASVNQVLVLRCLNIILDQTQQTLSNCNYTFQNSCQFWKKTRKKRKREEEKEKGEKKKKNRERKE